MVGGGKFMADGKGEASMEEILSSIKRIIAEDRDAADADSDAAKRLSSPKADELPPAAPVTAPGKTAAEPDDSILELTEAIVEPEPTTAAAAPPPERLIDNAKLDAMRKTLSALNTPEPAARSAGSAGNGQTSLEDLTRDLLRPMLKDWLDENLPALVERLVKAEIRRLHGE